MPTTEVLSNTAQILLGSLPTPCLSFPTREAETRMLSIGETQKALQRCRRGVRGSCSSQRQARGAAVTVLSTLNRWHLRDPLVPSPCPRGFAEPHREGAAEQDASRQLLCTPSCSQGRGGPTSREHLCQNCYVFLLADRGNMETPLGAPSLDGAKAGLQPRAPPAQGQSWQGRRRQLFLIQRKKSTM